MRADMERGRDATLRPTVIRAVVLGAIASVIGVVLGLLIDWFPAQGSTQADKIDTFWDVLIICSVPIFVLVATVVLVSVIKFRMRPGEEELDGPPIHGNTRLEVIWTSLPATILIALCAYAYIVLHDAEKAPGYKEMHVKVIGQQFTWQFEYTGSDGKKFTTTQLYVPEGKSVRFDVTSKDVLHDFWVPAWRMKIDAVPGITTHYRITPKKTGRKVAYPVVCAELCGLGHAFMRQTAHILPEQEFNDWFAKQSQGGGAAAGGGAAGGGAAGGGTGSDTAAGKQVFASNGCASCHTLSDAGASGNVGPDLDKVLATRDDAFIKQSIVDPGAFVEKGFQNGIMPQTYGKDIKPADIDALVKYLSSVTHK
jgi:cytochrome c oxidase subunit II